MSDEEHHFESKADAGASKTYPQQAGTIRKNGHIVIKGRPCKVSLLTESGGTKDDLKLPTDDALLTQASETLCSIHSLNPKAERIRRMEKNGGKGKVDETQKEKQKQNNKKRKQVFPYGNYKSYYSYRIGEGVDGDPRLKVFRKEWFEGKDCLDIGCNNGIITIQIALKFKCRSILGIDIDSDRVADAEWNLRKTTRVKSAGNKPAKVSKVEDKNHTDNSENNVTVSSNGGTEEISKEPSSLEKIDLSSIVSFKRENFVQSRHPQGSRYDTILCLSVSKWIHLNWGDDGLITLFSEIWRLLRPGGIFVLEPQPWKSYESNRNVSETTAANYRNIMFRPAEFQDILLDKIGFRTVEAITSDLTGSNAGFNRPILIFQK